MSHFANKETRAPWRWVICPRSLSYLVVKLRIKLKPLTFNPVFFLQYPGTWGSGLFFQEERKQNMPEAHRVGVFLAQHQLWAADSPWILSAVIQVILSTSAGVTWSRRFTSPLLRPVRWSQGPGLLAVESSFTWDGSFIFFLFLIFVYFWLCWVFIAALGLYLVAVHGLLSVMVPLAAEPGL